MTSGRHEVASRLAVSGFARTVTSPAPARTAAALHRRAAPVNPGEPAIIPTRPQSPLWRSNGRAGSQVLNASAVAMRHRPLSDCRSSSSSTNSEPSDDFRRRIGHQASLHAGYCRSEIRLHTRRGRHAQYPRRDRSECRWQGPTRLHRVACGLATGSTLLSLRAALRALRYRARPSRTIFECLSPAGATGSGSSSAFSP